MDCFDEVRVLGGSLLLGELLVSVFVFVRVLTGASIDTQLIKPRKVALDLSAGGSIKLEKVFVWLLSSRSLLLLLVLVDLSVGRGGRN